MFTGVFFSTSFDSDSGDEMSDFSDTAQDDENMMGGRKMGKLRWTKHEDAALKILVQQHGERWDDIAKFLKDRTEMQCQQRWIKVVNPDLIKGPWTKEVNIRRNWQFDWGIFIIYFCPLRI